MSISKQGEEVRALLARETNGMLCTLSKRVEGWPFGSITPFAMTQAGEPIVLISEIAEHTRNVRRDARASLLVRDSTATDDQQAAARVTLMGYAMAVPGAWLDDARERYLALFPNSKDYFEVHDFSLFLIHVTQARFIGGFGQIFWLDGNEVVDRAAHPGTDPLAPHARMVCDHMNEDHPDALRLYAAAFAGLSATEARMVHVDRFGFDMVAVSEGHHRHLRIDFPEAVLTTEQVRQVMVEMVRSARQKVSS